MAGGSPKGDANELVERRSTWLTFLLEDGRAKAYCGVKRDERQGDAEEDKRCEADEDEGGEVRREQGTGTRLGDNAGDEYPPVLRDAKRFGSVLIPLLLA